nr:hypothetical protein [Tanacetum cinerariifolium]
MPDHRSTVADHRSMTANHGGDRRSMVAVNDSRQWWTTVDHHRTTGQRWLIGRARRVKGRVWIGFGPGLDRVWAGSGLDFDREDVETLWKLVKAKYGSTRPEGDYERVLWGDLKVMFKPHIEDEVWRMQQRYNVVRWMLFNSYGIHCLSL